MPFPRPLRLLAPLLVGLSLILSACGGGPKETTAKRVILITCDTLRADRLGMYGFEHPTSPVLDTLAKEGLVFDRAYSTAPLTLPSVCSMLTGRLPEKIGLEHNGHFLQANARTIAEALSEEKIPTAAVVSNWVLVNPPNMPASFGVRQGFEHFDGRMMSVETVRKIPERRAAGTTNAAIEWVDKQMAAEDDRFFLWVHYQDPHGPYVPPPGYVRRMNRPLTDEAPVPFTMESHGVGGIPRYQMVGEEGRPEFYRIRYDAEIRFFDTELGRLLKHLEANDLVDDSLIIFSADHGESLGEHDCWFTHGENLNHELLHVPMVVRYPDDMVRPASIVDGDYRRVPGLVNQLDIYPTILTAFGIDPGRTPGTNLITAEPPGDRVAIQMLGFDDGRTGIRTINDQRWRLHLDGEETVRLYDLEADPGEEHDVAAAHPDVIAALRARYAQALKNDSGETIESVDRILSDEERRILNGLGYGDSEPSDDE